MTHFANGGGTPIGWSPSHRLLAVSTGAIPSTNGTGDNIVIIDTTNDALTPTNYSYFNALASNSPTYTVYQFIGLMDDQSFLGAIMTYPASGNVADMQIRAGALFYGGYASASEGGAFLHRVDLATGQDTKLVALGLAGDNGCFAGPPCNWTGPWDVSSVGTKVIYHHPGPTSTPSDINTVADTPLLVANTDGSAARTLFDGNLLGGMASPAFAPSGAWVARTGIPLANTVVMQVQAVTGGSIITVPTPGGPFLSWRGDSQAVVFNRYDQNGTIDPLLFTLADGKTKPLTPGTSFYLWAA